MPCPTPTNYVSQIIPRSGGAGIGGFYAIYASSYFNGLPNEYLGFGLTCEQAYDAIIPALPSLLPSVVANGTIITRPVEADFNIPIGGQISLRVDGVFAGGFDRSEEGFEDNTTFDWPGVAGVNFMQTLQFTAENTGGDVNSEMTYAINSLSEPFDEEEWWCCNATGCVPGGCGATAFYGGRFLIPPPATPAPGEENSTTPILFTPLYLANYTYQFIKNYGRVKK